MTIFDELNATFDVSKVEIYDESYKEFNFKKDVLDYGYLQYIDGFGSDACVAAAARVSYAQNTKKSNDEGLIRYLMRHKHTSPFEMVEVKFQIRMPIFVARQWIRHRTANVNEVSGRYSKLDRLYYNPQLFKKQSTTNHQGSGDYLDKALQTPLIKDYQKYCDAAMDLYDYLLSCGVSKEQARYVLPLSTYTTIIWKIDLHNLFHFIKLRLPNNAQYEIRVYAKALYDFCCIRFPISTKAFYDYQLKSKQLSLQEYEVIKQFTRNKYVEKPETLSTREFDQLKLDFF